MTGWIVLGVVIGILPFAIGSRSAQACQIWRRVPSGIAKNHPLWRVPVRWTFSSVAQMMAVRSNGTSTPPTDHGRVAGRSAAELLQ
jgi:hypothetical protein